MTTAVEAVRNFLRRRRGWIRRTGDLHTSPGKRSLNAGGGRIRSSYLHSRAAFNVSLRCRRQRRSDGALLTLQLSDPSSREDTENRSASICRGDGCGCGLSGITRLAHRTFLPRVVALSGERRQRRASTSVASRLIPRAFRNDETRPAPSDRNDETWFLASETAKRRGLWPTETTMRSLADRNDEAISCPHPRYLATETTKRGLLPSETTTRSPAIICGTLRPKLRRCRSS